MNWEAIYNFVVELLFQYEMDQSLFQVYLNNAQSQIEGMRPWVILRGTDSSQSCGPSTTWQTAFILGSVAQPFLKFFQTVTTGSIILVDSNNNPYILREIPFADRYQYMNVSGVFCVDYPNKNLYIMGQLTQTYKIVQNYIYRPSRLSPSPVDNIWVFDNYDSDASKVLGFLIALMWKGIDYDLINLQNATQLGAAANQIIDRLVAWDADLQVNMQSGKDPFGNGTIDWQAGRLPGGLGPS